VSCYYEYEEPPPEALEEWRVMQIELEIEKERATEYQALITVAEAARRMSLNHKTIRQRINRGEIARFGSDRAVRVRWGDVVACFTHRPKYHRDTPEQALRTTTARCRRSDGSSRRFSRLAKADRDTAANGRKK